MMSSIGSPTAAASGTLPGRSDAPDKDVEAGCGRVDVEELGHAYQVRRAKAPVPVFYDVNMRVSPGEFVSIVGPSGCGKSTLLKIIAGLVEPAAGVVVIDGTPVTAPRRSVSMMFQHAHLFPWRTALQNALLPIAVRKQKTADYEDEARAILEMVGLKGFEDAYPRELSGGMQQRVALSRTFISKPEVMLMDEPFGALDEQTRERLNIELLRIWDTHKTTVLFVTHSVHEAVFLSDRVFVMGARPSSIVADFRIDLPRPRRAETMADPEYMTTLLKVRNALFSASDGGAL